ncbi:hypothetical protein TOT_020000213 [Theileria orientalis strain Shintoku]|uniref:Uncharacterized protein n=1 Tax=Theileria orientalis strain Shintoku TaxID=869250 RepID=J4CCT3_THEOR|nr:hypothetical protein TOT_020000213 [Theileria orientalis strain Shintoku]BAM39942.1 hypothetical protein TOT_020000213 [Theileria orientalis strain Shintoku]|eukprot:XP_009690243.1 hypothetical protein TOT_020000213 [Theileria orientalis strain Shintoku]
MNEFYANLRQISSYTLDAVGHTFGQESGSDVNIKGRYFDFLSHGYQAKFQHTITSE